MYLFFKTLLALLSGFSGRIVVRNPESEYIQISEYGEGVWIKDPDWTPWIISENYSYYGCAEFNNGRHIPVDILINPSGAEGLQRWLLTSWLVKHSEVYERARLGAALYKGGVPVNSRYSWKHC